MPADQQGAAEDMSGLVDGIMHQLLHKDVLYQPIQEIGSKYPQWLEEHRNDTTFSVGVLVHCQVTCGCHYW